MIWYLSSFEDRYHQISRGDNYDKFYLLVLFDSISMSFSQGAGFGVRQGQINHSRPFRRAVKNFTEVGFAYHFVSTD